MVGTFSGMREIMSAPCRCVRCAQGRAEEHSRRSPAASYFLSVSQLRPERLAVFCNDQPSKRRAVCRLSPVMRIVSITTK